MNDEAFVTQTSPKSSLIYFSVLTLLLAVLFAVAYCFFPPARSHLMLIGLLLCVGFMGAGIILASSPPVTLRFKDKELYISDSNGKEYNVYAIPATDFVFMQTHLEKKFNIGCLRIKHTPF